MHDLDVANVSGLRAVDYKRLVPSTFADKEWISAEVLASPVPTLGLERGRSLVVKAVFSHLLAKLGNNHLGRCASRALGDGSGSWIQAGSRGFAHDVDWRLIRRLLQQDYVFFGSSRIILISHRPIRRLVKSSLNGSIVDLSQSGVSAPAAA